jgi:hypothetical protein
MDSLQQLGSIGQVTASGVLLIVVLLIARVVIKATGCRVGPSTFYSKAETPRSTDRTRVATNGTPHMRRSGIAPISSPIRITL